jgi:hypothetical protein
MCARHSPAQTLPLPTTTDTSPRHIAGGKSAILTAISVGLGGRVRSTGRGDSLVDLIQTGKTVASVTITLRNRGLNAYKQVCVRACVCVCVCVRGWVCLEEHF